MFESLLGRNWTEHFSLYGLLAETIDVSDDRQTFTFRLRPEAKFSDGTPVTAADVVFSIETLRDKGRPNFKNSYSKITKIETPDERTISFTQESGDRELPMIVGVMPILSKAFWEGKDFAATTLDPHRRLRTLCDGDDQGGRDHHLSRRTRITGARTCRCRRGCGTSTRCASTITAMPMPPSRPSSPASRTCGSRAIRCAGTRAMTFPPSRMARSRWRRSSRRSPAPAAGFVFNTRRKIFEDPRVREALVMAFDFEWANANLFANAYRRTYGLLRRLRTLLRGQARGRAREARCWAMPSTSSGPTFSTAPTSFR